MILGNKGYLSAPSQQNTGEGKSMYIGLSFLFVTIRRIIFRIVSAIFMKNGRQLPFNAMSMHISSTSQSRNCKSSFL